MMKVRGWSVACVVAVLAAVPGFAERDHAASHASDLYVAAESATSAATAPRDDPAAEDAASSRSHVRGKGGGEAPASDEATRVAVTDFDDMSRARIDNLGSGFADKLAGRLAESGVRVVGRGEIESLMQEEGLDPTSLGDLSFAARELGVDLIVSGVVESLSVNTTTGSLWLFRASGAESRVEATAGLIDAASDAFVMTTSASGTGVAPLTLSLDLTSLLFPSPACDVCDGGLRVERTSYSEGELVSIGYSNDSLSGWFGVEVAAADGTFLRWLGWHYVARDACETWLWNQRDALGAPVGAGVYATRVRAGDSVIESASFQVRPGISLTLPSLEEITVGSAAFDGGVAGVAIDDAVGRLAALLLPTILAHNAAPAFATALGAPLESSPLLGQVASVLPDGRTELNVGALNGVAVGDLFEVLAVDNLTFDPDTQAIVSYDVLETKGQIEIIEVRERASTGLRLGEFGLLVGDLVRFVP